MFVRWQDSSGYATVAVQVTIIIPAAKNEAGSLRALMPVLRRQRCA